MYMQTQALKFAAMPETKNSSFYLRKFSSALQRLLLALCVTFCSISDSHGQATLEPKTAEHVQSSVVRIFSIYRDGSAGWGSGIPLNETGDIATNNHVVQQTTTLLVFRLRKDDVDVRLAKIVNTDTERDIALIHINPMPGQTSFTLCTAEPTPAQIVWGSGFPGIADNKEKMNGVIGEIFSSEASADAIVKLISSGDAAAIDRSVRAGPKARDAFSPSIVPGGVSKMTVRKWEGKKVELRIIVHSAPINHGNSGGPLVNADGNVIGINSARGDKDPENGQFVSLSSFITELVSFAQLNKIPIKMVDTPPSTNTKMPLWKVITISVAGALALLALGLTIYLMNRKAAASAGRAPSVTEIVGRLEQMGRVPGGGGNVGGGGHMPPPPPPYDSSFDPTELVPSNHYPSSSRESDASGISWELEVTGPGGFRQNLRMTEQDFREGRGRVVVGRSAEFSQLAVRHDSISRQHLQFELRNGSLVVADRNSSNGTKVNQQRLTAPFQDHPLREGDTIQFGELSGRLKRAF